MLRTALRARTAKSGRQPSEPKQERKPSTRKPSVRKPARKPSARKQERRREPARERGALPLPVRLLVILLALGAMVAFAAVLARLTLEPSPASESLIHTNLHPGRSLRAYLDQPELRDAFKQIGGNIVLGLPFGLLLPVLAPRTRGVLRVVLLTAAVMLLVELLQGTFITGRAFDIDDVILNTSGALLGYLLLGRRISRAVHGRRRSRNTSKDG
ncbi:VanZ family protein [Streptomyces sp. NPDC127072]|uniref:VanZ family protein n=1 Tax=Streptomyces sp. NPDC127072 TaxID=3347129 RepID=UPI003654FED9